MSDESQTCLVKPGSMLSRSHNKAIRRSCVDIVNNKGKVKSWTAFYSTAFVGESYSSISKLGYKNVTFM